MTIATSNSWIDSLLHQLRQEIAGTSLSSTFKGIIANTLTNRIHLAVFVEPYLTFVLKGKKTVESRFSVHRHPPYEQVETGDLVILKKSSGPICGICRVSNVWYYRLDPSSWADIEQHAAALCMDESAFWAKKRNASFATLMRLEDVVPISDLPIDKVDPRGWVVLKDSNRQWSLI
jgi:hypothetical protein